MAVPTRSDPVGSSRPTTIEGLTAALVEAVKQLDDERRAAVLADPVQAELDSRLADLGEGDRQLVLDLLRRWDGGRAPVE